MRSGILLTTIVSLVILIGCSTSASSPTFPSDLSTGNQAASSQSGTTHLWGLWDVSIDPTNWTVDIVPLRGVEFTANVVSFMEPTTGPGGLGILITDVDDWETEGRIGVDVLLLHPFPGFILYTGFDVYGIFVHKGGTTIDYGSETLDISDKVDAAFLENSDGYTCWMSPALFPTDGTILTFTPGKLGNPGFPGAEAADANGYKYFADGLASDESVAGFYMDEGNFNMRGAFTPGSSNMRNYILNFPTPGGSPLLEFQYAVTANWEEPDETLSGDPTVLDVPGDFPPEANAKESFFCGITDNSTTFYVDETNWGGAINLDLEIFDWDCQNGIGNIYIAGDVIDGDYVELLAGSYTLVDGSFNSSIVSVEITDPILSGVENQEVLIVVESLDPTTYDQGMGTVFPDLPLANYFRHTLNVADEPQVSEIEAYGEAEIEPYFDGFGPEGTIDDPIPTEWWLTLDASGSTGPIDQYLWELNGNDLYDDAEGMVVSAGFPDVGTHVIKLKVTDGFGGESTYDLPGSYEVVPGTYVWWAFPGDFNDGTRDFPWITILEGLADCGTDGYVLVRGDDDLGGQCTYTADLLITNANMGTRIQGYYGDYDTDEPPMQTGYVRIEGNSITFDGFEVTGPSNYFGYSPYNHRAKLGCEGGLNALFRHLYIHDIGAGCRVIEGATAGDLLCQNILEVTLNALYINNQTHYGTIYLKFENCTFDRLTTSGSYGFGFYRSGGSADMVNTIWTDCGGGSFNYIGRAGGTLNSTYTCTSDTPTPPDGGVFYYQMTPGVGCIFADPDYVDPFTDHHIEAGSPAEDTGDPSIEDYDGTLSDMGCYGGPYGDWDFEN